MRYSYICAALFAAAAIAGPISLCSNEGGVTGDIGAGGLALGNGGVTGVKNAPLSDEGISGDDGAAALIGGDGNFTGAQNAKREEFDEDTENTIQEEADQAEDELMEGQTVKHADDLIDLGFLGNGNPNSNYYGGGGISLKRDENAEDDFIGPIEIGSPVLDINNL